MNTPPFPARREGFSLVETVIVLLLLTLVMGSAVAVVLRSEIFSGEFRRHSVIDQTGWRIMDRIGEELRAADPTTLLPVLLAGNDYVVFQQVKGFSLGSGGKVKLLDTVALGFRPAEGETINGLDDNGDGRADEGFVVHLDMGSDPPVEAPPGFGGTPLLKGNKYKYVPLAGHVLGLRFDATAGGITYSVDVGLVDRSGAVTRKTFTETVSFRN